MAACDDARTGISAQAVAVTPRGSGSVHAGSGSVHDDFSWVQGARQFPFCELGRNSLRRTAKCASRSMSRSSAQTINALNLDGLRRSSPPSTLARSSATKRAAVTFAEFEPGVPVRQKPSAFCLLLKDKRREGGDLDGQSAGDQARSASGLCAALGVDENSKWVAFRRASRMSCGQESWYGTTIMASRVRCTFDSGSRIVVNFEGRAPRQ